MGARTARNNRHSYERIPTLYLADIGVQPQLEEL